VGVRSCARIDCLLRRCLNSPSSQPIWMHSPTDAFVVLNVLVCVPGIVILQWCHNAPQLSLYCQWLHPPRSTAFVRFKESRLRG